MITFTAARILHPGPYGRLPRGSLERILVAVQATGTGTARVWFAFTPASSPPAGGDWVRGTWADGQPPGRLAVTCMTGPGTAADLAPGEYQVHIRLDAPPARPQRAAGMLIIT